MDGRSTEQASARIAAQNAIHKRKFPVGFDCRSRLYRIWRAMYFRCYQESHEAYPRYGGRGIEVCDRWLNYQPFMEWAIASGYKEGLTIDRINNDLGYYPVNCRWVTMAQQQQNRRNNLAPMTAFGQTKTLHAWAHEYAIPYQRLWKRLTSGRSLEWSLTTPACAERRRKPMSDETKARISAAHKRRMKQ